MDEEQWLACRNPTPMLEFLRGIASERKLRLFACGCVRRVWYLLTWAQSQRLVEVGELYADGLVNEGGLSEARQAYDDHLNGVIEEDLVLGTEDDDLVTEERVAEYAACEVTDSGPGLFCALHASHHAASARDSEDGEGGEPAAQADLLRDIFGNPFSPPLPLDPSLRAWHDGLIARLAQAAYDDRDLPSGNLKPARLAVLADALEEAGHQDAEILAHLRSRGVHVRGCHGVDAVLNRS